MILDLIFQKEQCLGQVSEQCSWSSSEPNPFPTEVVTGFCCSLQWKEDELYLLYVEVGKNIKQNQYH